MKLHCYDYPRPAVTVDAVVFGDCDSPSPKLLLIQRDSPPFRGMWAFPGGFMDMDETAEKAVARELREETGIEVIEFEQLYTSTRVDRDPRGRVISIAYIARLNEPLPDPEPADDARSAKWFSLKSLPPPAFDHQEILNVALEKFGMPSD